MAHTCNPTTSPHLCGVGRATGVQGHTWLHIEFEGSLSYTRTYFKTNKERSIEKDRIGSSQIVSHLCDNFTPVDWHLPGPRTTSWM